MATLLNEWSGLGVSGISDEVFVKASETPEAREALDLFVYRAVREADSPMATLGGLNTIVSTKGIGEHAAHVGVRVRTAKSVPAKAEDRATSCRCPAGVFPLIIPDKR